MNLDQEEWKPIILPGIPEGDYELSNKGRVKSYKQTKRGKIMSATSTSFGAVKVSLTRRPEHVPEGQCPHINVYIKKLVAKFFVPNPNEYVRVINKDDNPKNCCADNLEWIPGEVRGCRGHTSSLSMPTNFRPDKSRRTKDYSATSLHTR